MSKSLPVTLLAASVSTIATAQDVTVAEARTMAKEAYIYGFPVVANYRVMHAYAVDRTNPEFKAPFNELRNVPRVFTAEDMAIPTPNSDTPYSFAWLDLRAEPMVVTVPSIPKDRYFSVQFVDAYMMTNGYLGGRATDGEAGDYLVVGPGWKGAAPVDIKKVIHTETELVLSIFRTQLDNPSDLDNVKKIQAGYKAEPLSRFLRKQPPPTAPAINFIPPLTPAEERTSPAFFNILAFALQFCPINPSEVVLRERFTKLGIVPGKPFKSEGLPEQMKEALKAGMEDGQKEISAKVAVSHSTDDLIGTRQFLKNDYVRRAAGTQILPKEETVYLFVEKDANGQPLDGSKNSYSLRFAKGGLPPVHSLWSLTVYDLLSATTRGQSNESLPHQLDDVVQPEGCR
jgi:hypothetical protein